MPAPTKPAHKSTAGQPPIAISYVRFSSKEQRKGDSLRRQTEATEQWCKRHGTKLDESLSLRDLGTSAFRGKHRSDKAALGGFLLLVEQGKVPVGSYLVIENLDRLSREDERTALRLWMDILDHGINIVQLTPETVFRHEKSDMFDVMRAIMELSRGHSESVIKSERIGKAWAAKRKRLAEAGGVLTGKVPAWIEVRGGQLRLHPKRAAVVRRIFQMAGGGYGLASICKKLTEEKVPAFGNREWDEEAKCHKAKGGGYGSGKWVRKYVFLILNDRRALGELEAGKHGTRPDEATLMPNYYPPVVTEREFLAARAGANARNQKPGRIGKNVASIFGGLLRHAKDGDTFYAFTRTDTHTGKHSRVLINYRSFETKTKMVSFPLPTFEQGLLHLLRELDPDDVLPPEPGPNGVAVVENELAFVRNKQAELEAELLKGDLPAIAAALRDLTRREEQLVAQLEEGKEAAAVPPAQTWEEARSLVAMLEKAAAKGEEALEDVRLRLRAAVRRVIDSVWLLITSSGVERFAVAQIRFRGTDAVRIYSLYHKPPRFGGKGRPRKPGRWWASSFRLPGDAALDLRQPENAAKLEKLIVPVVRETMKADLKAREVMAAAHEFDPTIPGPEALAGTHTEIIP
jgi:DNA invertase Pin-like site-specific DNA recombinase